MAARGRRQTVPLWIKFRKSQDSSRRPAAGCRQLAGERGLLGGRPGSLGIANPETSWPAEAKANSEHTSPAQPLVKLFILGPYRSTSLAPLSLPPRLPPPERASSEFDTPCELTERVCKENSAFQRGGFGLLEKKSCTKTTTGLRELARFGKRQTSPPVLAVFHI